MGRFLKSVKQMIFAAGHTDSEERKLVQFVNRLELKPGQKFLDVGCGYGAKLKLFAHHPFELLGVEVNPVIVEANRKAGLNCVTVDEFKNTKETYDVILFSHIIEHFSPDALLQFMDFYLDRLKTGGHVILITPLFTSRFYNDFDHVKPYYPTAIQMVFGKNGSQVQYYSKNKLQIEDLWFRRSPVQIDLVPGVHVASRSPIPNYLNLLFRLVYRASFGLISVKDAWLGIYRKVA